MRALALAGAVIVNALLLLRGLRRRFGRLARPIVGRLLGALKRFFIFEAWRHGGSRAGQDLVVLNIKSAQPALLAHGQRDEIADLDELRLAEVLVQARPELVVDRQVPGDRLGVGERRLLLLVIAG